MDWKFWLAVVMGVGILLWLIISRIVQRKRKDRWLKKIVELNRVDYIEDVLAKSLALSPLFSLAKSLGIYFKLHPDSFKCDGEEWYHWDATLWGQEGHVNKEIRLSVNPETLQVVPSDSWDQRVVMAHEISHIISPRANLDQPCFSNQDFRKRWMSKKGYVACLFHELDADLEAKKLLERYFGDPPVSNRIIEQKTREMAMNDFQRCSVCFEEVEKESCPMTYEIKVLALSFFGGQEPVK